LGFATRWQNPPAYLLDEWRQIRRDRQVGMRQPVLGDHLGAVPKVFVSASEE